MPKVNKKKKLLKLLNESQYVEVNNTYRTENDNTVVEVMFHENATYEITEYICDIANDHDFRVKGIIWEGGVKFVKEESGITSRLSL